MANIYIQRHGNGYRETVDEIEIPDMPRRQVPELLRDAATKRRAARAEARRLLGEYRLADPYARYYLSQRACSNWRD